MPSNFPGSADTFDDAATIHGKKQDGSTDLNPPTATYHSDLLGGLGDAIAAVERWLLGGQISFQAQPGQTEPSLVLKDEGGTVMWRVVSHGTDRFELTGGTVDFSAAAVDLGGQYGSGTSATYGDWYVQSIAGTEFAEVYFNTSIHDDGTNRSVSLTATTDQGYFAAQVTDTLARFVVKAVPGQTTPVIVAKDENGNDIFTVGPDGTLTPAPIDPTAIHLGDMVLTELAVAAAGIPADPALWIDASRPSTRTGSGSNVTAIRDMSTNHIDFTGGTSPTLELANLNGLDTLGFDGSQSLSYAGAVADTNFLHEGAVTIFMVVNALHAGAVGPVLSNKNENGPTDRGLTAAAWYGYFSGPTLIVDSGQSDDVAVVADTAAPDNTWTVLTFVSDPAAAAASRGFIYRNGVSVGSTNSHTGTVQTVDSDHALLLGGGPAGNLTGSVAEVIVYEGVLDSDDRGAVENYLNHKWFDEIAGAIVSGDAAGGDLTGTYPDPTVGTNKVTNAKAAQMAANTLKGNNTGSTANAADLTVAQVRTVLGLDAGVVLRKSTRVGDATNTIDTDGIIIATSGSNMNITGKAGLFRLNNGHAYFHDDHGFTPDGGDATHDRIDTVWIAEGVPDSGSDPAGAGYEINSGTPSASPVPAAPSTGSWTGWVLLAEIRVPANATHSNQCTVTDRRVFV